MIMKVFRRILFYILSFTWGALCSVSGLVVILAAALCGGKLKTYHGRLYCVIGNNWGGFELGCFFLCSKASDHEGSTTRAHECGHGLQNCLWGPLMLFVITIPSAIRYWYREFKYHRKGLVPPTMYDDIWFEGQATRWGQTYVDTDWC